LCPSSFFSSLSCGPAVETSVRSLISSPYFKANRKGNRYHGR
jgi:hypothetical protein